MSIEDVIDSNPGFRMPRLALAFSGATLIKMNESLRAGQGAGAGGLGGSTM